MEIRVTTDDLVSISQAAKALNRARLTIYRWIGDGKIVAVKIGGFSYIPKNEIERLKNKEAARGATPAPGQRS